MKRVLSGVLLFIIILVISPISRGADRLLGPPYTYISITFTSGGKTRTGVTAILVDGSNTEWKEISNREGEVTFAIKAESGMAFLTYWEGESVPVYKKVFEYNAGNHYSFRLKLAK
ncbi:MAG: hypothetical protein RAO92_07210 [Candidatus Euphemobacter frigidus]|nr:hypothetical protein [Candidatus Euphemobacter frigidus]MDP8276175.1 hypothetical protein [Candidatus Euphemobacter frigidus]